MDKQTSADDVKRYYDNFVHHLTRDYIHGNRRLEIQYSFVGEATSSHIATALIVGCGSGESAFHVAERVAPNAEVLAVDIGSENIRVAELLFAHPRITYKVMDVTKDLPTTRRFDMILLPDVYEHIPKDLRRALHDALRLVLADRGVILLTVPSPSHQTNLRTSGEGLQIIDETVTLDDLVQLATDVGGHLSYYAIVNAFQVGDYIHAVVSAGPEHERDAEPIDEVSIRRLEPAPTGLARVRKSVELRTRARLRSKRVRDRLGDQAAESARSML